MTNPPESSLNVEIAKLLGWRAEWDGSTWRLFDPSGRVKYVATIEDEMSFWRRACLQNDLDFDHDLNASFNLPLNEGEELELRHFGKTYMARISISVSSRIAEADPPYRTGSDPARLCAEVWREHRQKFPLLEQTHATSHESHSRDTERSRGEMSDMGQVITGSAEAWIDGVVLPTWVINDIHRQDAQPGVANVGGGQTGTQQILLIMRPRSANEGHD